MRRVAAELSDLSKGRFEAVDHVIKRLCQAADFICRGRDSHEPEGEMPWFLTRQEPGAARSEGLVEKSFEDYLDLEDPPVRRFRALYAREA